MGSLFKQQFTKPIPTNAEVVRLKGRRCARWLNKRGKQQTALLNTEGTRIVRESKVYFARYRDGSGQVQTVSTECRDKQAAQSVLNELEKAAERIRAGIMTTAEAATTEHQGTPLVDHVAAYIKHMEAIGCCPEHRKNVNRQLLCVTEECRFARLADLDRHTLESWLVAKTEAEMSARTRNSYLTAAVAFANWCSAPTVRRLLSNPFDCIPKLNEKADPRHKRRAMNEDELSRLLAVALRRPLDEASMIRRGKQKGQSSANLRPETISRLEVLGLERTLIYKTLVLTGLRKGELASLTIGQLHLNVQSPFVELEAADEKSGEGNSIPIRSDLADDLRQWLESKLRRMQEEARSREEPVPLRLPPDSQIFDVPDKLCKILNRDLKAAGIPKQDERRRFLDVHALRHTFGTLLSKGGVSPRTAQAAMRHSKIDLTMNVYTDPRLMDVAGAIESLPMLPIGMVGRTANEQLRTGTDDLQLTQQLTRVAFTGVQEGSSSVNNLSIIRIVESEVELAVTSMPVNGKGFLSTADRKPLGVGVTGLEPVTPSVMVFGPTRLSRGGLPVCCSFCRNAC